ncbi:MAG: vWA domain-containing protein [Myxococcota bacterium]
MKRLSVPAVLILSALAGCSKSAVGTSPPAYAPGESIAADGAGYDASASEDAASYEEYRSDADGDGAYAEAPADDAPAMASGSDREMTAAVEAPIMADADEAEPPPAPAEPMAVSTRAAEESARPRRSRSRRAAKKSKAKRIARRDRARDVERRRPKPEPEPTFDDQIQAGRLTAGAFDDTLNPEVLAQFAHRMQQTPGTRDVASRVSGEMTVVRVVDERGRPVHDADVRLDTDRRGARVPTGTDGRAVFFAGWDLPPDQDRQGRPTAVIRAGRESISAPIREGTINTITMPDVQGEAVRAVDIALVIDATGSMSDELEYLKVELRNIARTVDRAFPQVDQRYALVVYRDEGDDYVSRSFDFTTNLRRFEDDLGNQFAGGGGDYPEAMHTALDDAARLSWDDDAAKVVFLVADAPPHDQSMRHTMDAVDDLRAQGVAFYPVAASGVASEAEIVMRAAAAGSGGQYLFLTDDSGVGNGHAEPHIPCYEVQALRDVMIRMVHSELAGERITADSRRTVRSVGRSNDGICERRGRARAQ